MTKQEVEEWKDNLVTLRVWKHLKARRQRLLEDWAAGAFSSETVDATAQLTARALGSVQELERVLEITYEELIDE